MRRVREIRDSRYGDLIVAEGVRLVEEALEAGFKPTQSLVSPRLYQSERGTALAARLGQGSGDSRDCSDEVLARASSLDTHQGCLAVFPRPRWREDEFFAGEEPFLVVAAGVQDPGNMGSLIRTAEAAGASGFLAMRGSADPYRDKTLRGAAGSAFRLPCRGGVEAEELLELCDRRGVALVAIDPRAGVTLWEADLGPAPRAFVVGSEGQGIPRLLRERCQCLVRIPMQAPVDSLNVAVAAGLVLFEHRRRSTVGPV